MISSQQFVVLTVFLYCSSLGHNKELEQVEVVAGVSNSSLSPSNSANSSPLCRLVRNWKRELLEEFKAQFKEELNCIVDGQDGCTNVTCSSEYNTNFTGGIVLHLCEKTPRVEFWTRSSNWNEGVKWSHNFTVQESQQTVEIVKPIQGGNESPNKQYLNVSLKLSQSQFRTESPVPYQYLVFSAAYQENESKEPMQQVVIVNSTRFPLNQICSVGDSQNLELRGNIQSDILIPSPKKRNDLKLDDLHTNMKQKYFPLNIGDQCDSSHVFRCGIGATCTVRNQTYAVCECLMDHIFAPNGTCIVNPDYNHHPVSPTVQPLPSGRTGSYSAALGALLSILVLLAIAGTVFFGTRYHVFARIRSRFPRRIRLPSWPFQRGSIDDQVVMVDPFAHEDDDPPLL